MNNNDLWCLFYKMLHPFEYIFLHYVLLPLACNGKTASKILCINRIIHAHPKFYEYKIQIVCNTLVKETGKEIGSFYNNF